MGDNPLTVRLAGAVDGGSWLASRSDLHPAEAQGLAGLAQDLPAMPATGEAFQAGRISTEKARLLRSAKDVDGFADAEASLVDRVADVTLRTARRIVNRFIADHRKPTEDDTAANEVTLSPRRNGRWRLFGDLDAETGAIVHNELRRLADAHRDDEALSLPRRNALAVLDMARRSITLGERAPGSRPELIVVADVNPYGELVDPRHEGGTPLTRQAFEHLSCDATIRGLIMNGPREVLDLGRSQRLATPGQRRAAAIRDGGCVYPGCGRPPDECDLHHIRHWLKHNGRTDLANLCLLCRRHHTLTHLMGFTFTRRKTGHLTIYRPDGTQLLPQPRAA